MYNGLGILGSLAGTFSGDTSPSDIFSDIEFLIEFHIDASEKRNGFTITYTITYYKPGREQLVILQAIQRRTATNVFAYLGGCVPSLRVKRRTPRPEAQA